MDKKAKKTQIPQSKISFFKNLRTDTNVTHILLLYKNTVRAVTKSCKGKVFRESLLGIDLWRQL